jgi:hypothetical protein
MEVFEIEKQKKEKDPMKRDPKEIRVGQFSALF